MTDASCVIQSEFTDAIAWRRDSLAADDGFFVLDQACLDELDGAISHLRANPLPVEMITPDLFELPACHTLMKAVSAGLRDGVGFAIVDRLNLGEYTRQEAVILYWLLASMIGRPVAQKWNGQMIYDVYDSGRKPGNGVRPDITNVEQNFHTDNSYNHCPPHILGLLCLQTAKQGGISRIISFSSAHNEMLRRYADYLARLYQPYYFDRQGEHAPDDSLISTGSIFEFDGETLRATLATDLNRQGYELAGEDMGDEARAALAAIDAVRQEPGLGKVFSFERGQIQLVNNRRIGHRRTAYTDSPDPALKRHLIRIWLRNHGRPFYHG